MADPARQQVTSGLLLETKLHVPRRRRGLVARPRLAERLDRGAEAKLTLVSAPAGFGKTTLLAECLAAAPARERCVAWLSLDPSDNRPAVFWTYLLAALQTVAPELDPGAGALALLQSPAPPPIETVLAAVLNELSAIPKDVVLVLDDYHVIDAPDVQTGMAFLLDHLPPRLHVVIASRADPPLPLARLRARGELVEIRAADLRFLPDEAAAYLNQVMGLELGHGQLAVLEGRTEGWIAALQLAALSMQGRDDVESFIDSFAGDDRYIVDYLVEEVLQRQPERVRSFLLQTAVLDRLSGPLTDAVTGQDGGKAMLEALDRGNLFLVPLDDRRRWYRYHHLFADVLRGYLREEQPDRVAILHGRASTWYERNGEPSEAIRHALAANDLARAAGLVEREAQATVRGHQPARLIDWLKPVPDDVIRAMPVLSAYYAAALMVVGEMEAADFRLSDAERWLEHPASGMVVLDQAAFRSLPSQVAISRGYLTMAAGDAAAAAEWARRALDLLREDDHHLRGNAALVVALAHWARGDLAAAQQFFATGLASLERAGDIVLALTVAYHQGEVLKARGCLVEAARMYERALQLAIEHGDAARPAAANLHFGLSELSCEQGDVERAMHHLQRGEALRNSAVGLAAIPYEGCLAQARLLRTQGALHRALDALDRAERLYVRGGNPDIRPIAAVKARVWILQGRLREALDWTHAGRLSVDDELDYSREFQHITLARVLIAQAERERDGGSTPELDRMLDRLLHAAEAGERTGSVIEILVLQALAHQLRGDLPAALASLERALALAEPEGYVRIFVDEGPRMAHLLEAAARRGIAPSYVRRLLAALGEVEDRTPAKRVLVEPLSERELDVLRLLRTDLDGPEIARELVVALSTVRTHTKSIYSKLGVNSRRAAVGRAEELGLVSQPRTP
jgi:LuxR family transcriptional regulator, maltose regulon positive regulatory protein